MPKQPAPLGFGASVSKSAINEVSDEDEDESESEEENRDE